MSLINLCMVLLAASAGHTKTGIFGERLWNQGVCFLISYRNESNYSPSRFIDLLINWVKTKCNIDFIKVMVLAWSANWSSKIRKNESKRKTLSQVWKFFENLWSTNVFRYLQVDILISRARKPLRLANAMISRYFHVIYQTQDGLFQQTSITEKRVEKYFL